MKITLVFLNNGSAVGRFEDSMYTYTHFYDDIQQLGKDYLSVISDGLDGSDLQHWDNNQPEMWENNETDWKCCCIYEEDTEEEIPYTAFTELDPAWGENVAEFLDSLSVSCS